MNKIILEKEINEVQLSEGIDFKNNILKITKDCTIDIKISNLKEEFFIEIENCTVVLNILGDKTKNKVIYRIINGDILVQKLVTHNSDKIIINLDSENSSITYRYSSINKKDNKMKMDVYHNYPKTRSLVVNHGLNLEKEDLIFDICGYIGKESYDCICSQDNKIINLKENKSCIRPNLIIDNNRIEANHSAYIGSFKEDEIFYLMSRGISRKDCYDLLTKAYLIGDFILDNSEEYLKTIKCIGGE